MKRGLVLEGGAMRGLFSAGVMDVMMEHGLTFDGVIGVSAGAAFGCNYKSHQIGRALRYNQLMARSRHYCSVWSLLFTGDLFNAKYAYHYVPTHIDIFDRNTFDRDPSQFYVVTTDVDTGLPIYHRIDRFGYDALEWIRASASMPVCSRIVHLGGHRMLDGGIADSIPLAYFRSIGYDRNVVVLTQPQGYVKGPNSAMPLMRFWLRRYPRLVDALASRHEMYNAQTAYVAQAEHRGEAYVIRPPEPLPIGHICHDPEQMQRVYDIGRATALDQIDKISNFLIGKPSS